MRRLLGALGFVVAIGVAAADVRYDDDRVTGRFDGVPVGEALAALAQATGADVYGTVVGSQNVRLELDAVSLEEALHRVLGAQNFTVRYGQGGRPKTIVLQSAQDLARPPPRTSPAAGAVAAPAPPTFPLVLSKMFDRHRPLTLSEPLAGKLGESKTSMPKLLEVATTDADGMTRVLATQAVLSALERESRYRRSFLRSLHRLEPDELAAIASGPTGARFEELLGFLAAHSREPTLQKKAGVVLDQLREAQGTAG